MKRILEILNPEITSKLNNMVLLAFRILASFALFRTHGLPKLDFSDVNYLPDPFGFGATFSLYFAIFANVVGAFLISIGLFTRIIALTISSLTLTGLFFVHINDPAKIQDTPLIYSIVFLTIAILGPGQLSIDNLIYKYLRK